MAPSTTGRCGPKGGPIGPFTGGSNGSIRAHISSVNTAVRDMHPRSRPQHVQLVRHALAARYLSAAAEARIGGDLYEVLPRPGAVRLIVGDVRGKGLDAVRTATVVLGEFRAAVDRDDLVDAVVQMDARLRPYLGDEDFVTALLA